MAADERIPVTCPACAGTLKVRAELAGKRGKCPRCGAAIDVPASPPPTGRLIGRKSDELAIPESDEVPALKLAPEAPAPRFAPPPEHLVPEAPARPHRAAPLPPAPTGLARHVHWLLALAFIPLALSVFGGPDDLQDRFLRTLEGLNERDAAAFEKLPNTAGADEVLRILPGHRVEGAHLARDSGLHWAYAVVAGAAFMGLMLAFPRGNSEPSQLFLAALFTATVGIALLLFFQVVAAWTQGYIVTGRGILTLLFWVVKFIGYSYRAASDPENGFMASMVGYTFGVGLCEELCKALPVIWHYRTRGKLDWQGACLWGLASGIGFGISEGIHYSGELYNGLATGGIYVVRFVSCVTLHAVWTAAVAIVIARDPGRVQTGMEWRDAVLQLLLVLSIAMVLHGLYDTLLKRDHELLALLVAFASLGWLGWLIERSVRDGGGALVQS